VHPGQLGHCLDLNDGETFDNQVNSLARNRPGLVSHLDLPFALESNASCVEFEKYASS